MGLVGKSWKKIVSKAGTGVLAAGFGLSAVFTAQVFAAAPAHSAPTTCNLTSFTSNNFTTPNGPRTVKVVVPPGANSSSPMIVSIHGALGSAASQENTSGYTNIGLRDGAIVVYPQAQAINNNVWDARPGSVDIDYVGQVVTFMHTYGCSNPSNTFVNGFSMGGMMSSRLLCSKYANLFAGAGMVGGVLPPTPGCTVDPNKPIVIVHGTADPVVLYDGTMPNLLLQTLVGGPELANYPGTDRSHMGLWWEVAKGCDTVSAENPGLVWYFDWTTNCRTAPTKAVAYLYADHVWQPASVSPYISTSEYIWRYMRANTPQTFAVPARSVLRVKTGVVDGTVTGNLTVVNPGTGGYTTAYPCNAQKPVASVNNFTAHQTIPNFTAVKTDSNGEFCVYTSSLADILWDQTGTGQAWNIAASTPERRIDTRTGNYTQFALQPVGAAATPEWYTTAKLEPAGAKVTKTLKISTGVPNVHTVMGNLTVTQPDTAGYTTAWPCDQPRPFTSVNNYAAGQTIPNFVAVQTDANGDFCVTSTSSAHLIFDQSVNTASGSISTAERLLDTRNPGWVAASSAPNQPATGSTQMPAGSKPAPGGATVKVHTTTPNQTLLGNLTVTQPDTGGYTTVWPCSQPRPLASTNNFVAGQTIPNFTSATTDANGDFCVFSTAQAHLVFDSYGTIAAAGQNVPAVERKIDTRLGGWTLR